VPPTIGLIPKKNIIVNIPNTEPTSMNFILRFTTYC
jgi:hypothetical protein